MTNLDSESIYHIYENTILANQERFGKIDSKRQEAIKRAERIVAHTIDKISRNDVFFYQNILNMLPDDKSKMINFNTPTMYTDGKSLYYNPDFVNSIPMEEVDVVVVHEILHVVLGHHIAFADVPTNDASLWHLVNIACDLSINHLLKDRAGFSSGLLLAGRGEFKDLPTGLNAREYYDLLLKKYQNQPQTPKGGDEGEEGEEDGEEGGSEGGGSKGGDGEEGGDEGEEGGDEGEEGGDEGGDGEEGGEGGEGGGEGGEGGEGGSEGGDGGEGGEGGGEGGEGGGEGVGKSRAKGKGTGNGKPSGKDVEIPQEIIDQYQKVGILGKKPGVTTDNQKLEQGRHQIEQKENLDTAEKIEKQRSVMGVGSGVGTFIGKSYRQLFQTTSKLPWAQILSSFSKPNTNRRNPRIMNRKFTDFVTRYDSYIPGYKGRELEELIFLVDVSGSMPRVACNMVFGEIAAISKTFREATARVVSFDDGIQTEAIFTSAPSKSFKSIQTGQLLPRDQIYPLPIKQSAFSNFKWSSVGGGTSIAPALAQIDKLRPLPKLVIILTDGWFSRRDKAYINSMTPAYKIIWLMVTNQRFDIGRTYDLRDFDYPVR